MEERGAAAGLKFAVEWVRSDLADVAIDTGWCRDTPCM